MENFLIKLTMTVSPAHRSAYYGMKTPTIFMRKRNMLITAQDPVGQNGHAKWPIRTHVLEPVWFGAITGKRPLEVDNTPVTVYLIATIVINLFVLIILLTSVP